MAERGVPRVSGRRCDQGIDDCWFVGHYEIVQPNGNTLICESFGSRVPEVTMYGDIVWECVFASERIRLGTTYGFPYDYCPQLAALPRPSEERVVPPPHAVVHPRHIRRGENHFDAR